MWVCVYYSLTKDLAASFLSKKYTNIQSLYLELVVESPVLYQNIFC